MLQYRPPEFEKLIKLLIDIKGALILTSSDQPVDNLIGYSYSENIFRNIKNKDGFSICQSNIGNLQIQLLKYDKAIYHLANSLQDNKLQRFLSLSLSDELDENESLYNQIYNFFNKAKKSQKNNILIEKQQNNGSKNFSQKIIGILINTRYCRLIYAYYKFFKGIKKLEKLNDKNNINGQFMNTYFHSIDYYHKIIIQYIYLSYLKNDLIKIGESILDYIEFLIKFKFKTSSEKKYILNIKYREILKYREKQDLKKKIFDKIIKWFDLFDECISYIKDNTSLGDDKSLVNDYSNEINNSENGVFNSVSQSAFLFKVNIQRGNFLKGKFALCCQNYNDALFYFIRAAKKKSIVIDGLIKKKSLKKINKLLFKMTKQYKKLGIINKLMSEKIFNQINKKRVSIKKKFSSKFSVGNISINNGNKINTFNEEIQMIKDVIMEDISKCNAKEVKDIIIIIDFNIYTKLGNNEANKDKINSFIVQTKLILNDYLSSNDRFAAFIFNMQYKILCPLMHKYQIDLKNFSKDLNTYKTKLFENQKLIDEYNINLEEFQNNINNDFKLDENNFINIEEEDESLESYKGTEKIINKIEGLIATVNYISHYIKIKEGTKNEKYAILFTDLFNADLQNDEIKNIFEKLEENKEIIFLLVGKNKNYKHEGDKDMFIDEINKENYIINLFLNKFGEKSEMINFENMSKIKNILSYNSVIKDEIIYPNEIYK